MGRSESKAMGSFIFQCHDTVPISAHRLRIQIVEKMCYFHRIIE